MVVYRKYEAKQCLQCQGEVIGYGKFCSRRCANVYNNNRKGTAKHNSCLDCGIIISYRRKYCDKCLRFEDVTLREVIYQQHHRSSAYAFVRSRARAQCKKRKQICFCGYDKHVEVCHIKPISGFDLDTLVSVVNADENLILLCPNHHWEFDNKLISPHNQISLLNC